MTVNNDISEEIYNRPRILISAYACEPNKGSEQGVGWSWALQLSRFASVTVITRANNEGLIGRELKKIAEKNINFVYYDPPKIITFLKKTGFVGFYVFYIYWQFGCYLVAKRLHVRKNFSHVMHLTFGNIWLPIFIHRLPCEFILGPVGGGEGIPDNLISSVGFKARAIQKFRKFLIATININPVVVGPVKRAKTILVRTQDTLSLIPEKFRSKTFCVLETGVDDKTLRKFDKGNTGSPTGKVRLLTTGRLVGFKNIEMLLHALQKANSVGAEVELRVIGEGPEKKRLMALSSALAIEHLVTFVGSITHSDVIEELKNADIFTFPSLREAGTWSLVEAMCASLPIVCVKTSGMAVITNADCAIAINPKCRKHIIDGFAQAIYELSVDVELRRELGKNARDRVEKIFHWDKQGERVNNIIFNFNNHFKNTREN